MKHIQSSNKVFFGKLKSNFSIFLSSIAFVVLYFSQCLSHEITLNNLTIYHPYLFVDDESNATGFLSIENHGTETDYLIDIESNFSSSYQIWRLQTEGDTKLLLDLNDGIEIPPKDIIHFAPEEMDLLFVDLVKNLDWYDPHTAVFSFKNSGTIVLEFEVEIP